MGSFFSTDNDGSCKSFSEPLAFPTQIANSHHISVPLVTYKELKFQRVQPVKITNNRIVIFCHGNGCTVGEHQSNQMQVLADYLGMDIYCPEYPGYGDTYGLGTPTSESCQRSLELMVEYLMNKHIDTMNMYLIGHSIGTGVIVTYAARKSRDTTQIFRAIILLAPFKSICRVITESCVVSPVDFYSNHINIYDIEAPICLMHGKNDEIIAYTHSQELFGKLNLRYINQLILLEKIDHNSIINDEICYEHIRDFIEKN